MSKRASIARLSGLKSTIDSTKIPEEIVEDNKEDWEYFMSDADKKLKSDMFNNPPENFVARLWDGSLVYAHLIENALLTDRQCLIYLVERNHEYNVVYLYSGRSAHQRSVLALAFQGIVFGDWRLVPASTVRCGTAQQRTLKIDWSLLIFHHYFDFPWFPEGDYYS